MPVLLAVTFAPKGQLIFHLNVYNWIQKYFKAIGKMPIFVSTKKTVYEQSTRIFCGKICIFYACFTLGYVKVKDYLTGQYTMLNIRKPSGNAQEQANKIMCKINQFLTKITTYVNVVKHKKIMDKKKEI